VGTGSRSFSDSKINEKEGNWVGLALLDKGNVKVEKGRGKIRERRRIDLQMGGRKTCYRIRHWEKIFGLIQLAGRGGEGGSEGKMGGN